MNIDNQTRRAESKFNKHQYTPVSNRSDSKGEPTFAIIEDNLRKRIKEVEERTVRASKRGIDVKVFDEKRMSIYIQGLRDLHDSSLISKSLVQFLIEGFEDTKRRMVGHEKSLYSMNHLMMKQTSDLEAKLKVKEAEVFELIKKHKKNLHSLEVENRDLKDEKSKLKQQLTHLQKELENYENKAKQLQTELDSLKQREIDRLEETDLDDVDLISENTKKKNHEKKPPHPLVPSLDFDKMRKLQEEEIHKMRVIKHELDETVPFLDNIICIDAHDEEFEDASSIDSQYKNMFYTGSEINSQSSRLVKREQELMLRKADVINQLNEIYAKDDTDDNLYDESEESGTYYQGGKNYDTDN